MSPSSLTRQPTRDGTSRRGLTETEQHTAAVLVVRAYRAPAAASRMPFGEGNVPQTSRNITGSAGEMT
jgi:uncharacterized protein YcbK (DUF882 family)